MANVLSNEKQAMAVSMLCEGNSIRGVERMTGIHRDTVMRLGVRIGEGCARLMDERMLAFRFGDSVWVKALASGLVSLPKHTA